MAMTFPGSTSMGYVDVRFKFVESLGKNRTLQSSGHGEASSHLAPSVVVVVSVTQEKVVVPQQISVV